MKFTPIQQTAFDILSQNKTIQKDYYFTGGTALSVFHLHHRTSDDLDFFSQKDVPVDFTNPLVGKVADKLKLSVTFTTIENTFFYELSDKASTKIMIDFASYPYTRLETGLRYQNVSVDGILDIGANKIAAINNRDEVKDFVDCFFIMKHYTIWDLLRAYEQKFSQQLDLVLFASNLLKVEAFDYLPKMAVPLALPELKKFYLTLADRLGKRVSKR